MSKKNQQPTNPTSNPAPEEQSPGVQQHQPSANSAATLSGTIFESAPAELVNVVSGLDAPFSTFKPLNTGTVPYVGARPSHKPTMVLVNEYWPSFREVTLDGSSGDYGVATLCGATLTSDQELLEFAAALSDEAALSSLIRAIYSRPDARTERGRYALRALDFSKIVGTAYAAHSAPALMVMDHLLTVYFLEAGLVAPDRARFTVLPKQQLVPTYDDIRKSAIEVALADMFASSPFATAGKGSPERNVTPARIHTTLSAVMRSIVHSLPALKAIMLELDTTRTILVNYLTRPYEMDPVLASDPVLLKLADVANVFQWVTGLSPTAIGLSTSDARARLHRGATAILSTATWKLISLQQFVDRFTVVPLNEGGPWTHGVIIAAHHNTSTTADVVSVTDLGGQGVGPYSVTPVPQVYTGPTSVVSTLQKAFGEQPVLKGLMNLIADEAGRNSTTTLLDPVVVYGPGLPEEAFQMYAIGLAESIYLVNSIDKLDGSEDAYEQGLAGTDYAACDLVYTARVSPQWRSSVAAATDGLAMFTDEWAMLAYTLDEPFDGSGHPAVSTSLGSQGRDVLYYGTQVSNLLKVNPLVTETVRMTLPDRAATKITLRVNALGDYLMVGTTPLTSTSFGYRVVDIPVLTDWYDNVLGALSALASGAAISDAVKGKAMSSLTTGAAYVASSPIARDLAYRALRNALVTASVDSRAIAGVFDEVLARASLYAGMTLAIQHGRVSKSAALAAVNAVPTWHLTREASQAYTRLYRVDLQG